MPKSATPAYITSLLRHFEDLWDGTHGCSASRKDKEAHFEKAVELLAPIARRVLDEVNTTLLRDTGELTESGLRRTPDRGLNASWALSWPEQRAAGVEPIVLQAVFGSGFHHPHLRGTTVRDWPLNVFSVEDAAAQLSILRAIASSDLHNLVYQSDYRIVPAVTANLADESRDPTLYGIVTAAFRPIQVCGESNIVGAVVTGALINSSRLQGSLNTV